MKRTLYTMIMMSLGTQMYAQTAYDAAAIMKSDLNGTARYVGMGGALGALGADLSTMGTNPAGTGMYRRSDASFTLGGLFTDNPGALRHDKSRASVDQAGIVFCMSELDDDLGIINMGVNYVKKNNYLGNFNNSINLDGGSQTTYLAGLANQALQRYDFDTEHIINNVFGPLCYYAVPFRNGDLELINDGIITDNLDDNDQLADEILNTPHGIRKYKYLGIDAQNARYSSATFGNNSQVDINLSANLNDRFFVGGSVGVYSARFSRETIYSELGTDGYSYNLGNYYHNSSDGIDFKFGVIARPIEDSPFRIGLAIHSPIWYTVKDYTQMTMTGYDDEGNITCDNSYDSDVFEYNMRTPWKFNVSMGHTVGNYLAIGLEYEYQDLTYAKFSEARGSDFVGNFAPNNDHIKACLKPQHTLKAGFEVKPDESFAIRFGYNYVSAPMKSDAYYGLTYNSTLTETNFINWKDTHRLTVGLGYRYKGGYIDLAYQYQMQKGDYYAYDDEYLTPTTLENNRSQLMATLGFRF